MKAKIGIGIRVLSILLFVGFITPNLEYISNPSPFLIIMILVLILLNISQLLSPLSLKKNILLYFGLISYFFLVLLWSKDYGFNREFDYKGEKLSYKYSIFNGSYLKLFGDKRYYGTLISRDNDKRKEKAIDIFVFMQCEIFEREQSYTEKQRDDIKHGHIAIYNSYRCKKCDLKDFILNEVEQNQTYLSNYKYVTKQQKVEIDTIVKYRHEIFNIYYEE